MTLDIFTEMKETLKIKIDNVTLEGELNIPENPIGLIIFAHGSGSSRFSTRNRLVAKFLNVNGLATFLFDALTKKEDENYEIHFDIELLSRRLEAMTRYLLKVPETKNLPFAYFGTSTGAASALIAASKLRNNIKAIVSRGGLPDMASEFLQDVEAPTLLIVGELDFQVIALNEKAFGELECQKSLKIIKRATHLFEEPGAMSKVLDLSLEWFMAHLSPIEAEKSIF